MAEWGQGIDWAFKSNQDLSAKRYGFVSISGSADQTIAQVAAYGAKIAGVLLTKPKSLEHATVRLAGVTKCVAGGTICAGDVITSNASGVAVVGSGECYLAGYALSGVASGGVFTLNLDISHIGSTT